MKNKKGNAIIIGAIVIVVFFVVAGIAWIVGSRMRVPVKQAMLNKQETQKTETQSEPADETADWYTYVSALHEFEFKYPAGFVMLDEGDTIRFLTKEQYDAEIKNNEYQLPYLMIQYGGLDGIYMPLDGTRINFADGTAIGNNSRLENTNGEYTPSYDIITERGDILYCITFTNKNENTLNTDDKLILSTFKFANASLGDISDWKTYTNTEFDFEFKYPSDATVVERTGTGIFVLLKGQTIKQTKNRVFNLSRPTIDDGNTLEAYKNAWLESESGNFTSETLANADAWKITGAHQNSNNENAKNLTYHYFIRKNYTYLFAIENNTVGEKILSTFKFIK